MDYGVFQQTGGAVGTAKIGDNLNKRQSCRFRVLCLQAGRNVERV